MQFHQKKYSELKIWKKNKKLANLQCKITEKTTIKFGGLM